nr:tetratricopeptide repeat protein 7A [Ipomoea trifida]
MLCACSGEQFKFEEPEPAPQSPESLATRDFSASGLSSRTGTADWESRFEEAQVDEVESTLKEALSLNYEEARALLGRLEYQRGNFDAALQVFQGIDIKTLSPRMSKAITERTRPRKSRGKGEIVVSGVMSLHSVSLLLEAILLKSKSLAGLGRIRDAARECKAILDIVDSAFPNGMLEGVGEDCKLQEMFHKALELLPKLWVQEGLIDEAVNSYRRALVKPWNLDAKRLASLQKDLAIALLFAGVEVDLSPRFKIWCSTPPKNNMEEAILLLFVLMWKIQQGEIEWDSEVMDHLTFALTVVGEFESLADNVEQILPGIKTRAERWYFLALCYSAAGQNETALNLLRKVCGSSEAEHEPHIPSLLLGAKLCSYCSQDPCKSREGISFSRRAIDSTMNQNKHLLSQARKFLGVCYGNAAKISVSDSERNSYQTQSLNSLTQAAMLCKEDAETVFSLGLEYATQRNLTPAFDNALRYSEMTSGSTAKGWKLLALIVSAEQRFSDAEAIVDLALDETGQIDQLQFLKLKAVLQIARQQPNRAMETYRILLAMIQAQRQSGMDHEVHTPTSEVLVLSDRKLEVEAWLDLARIYIDQDSWPDAQVCIDKAKSIDIYSPQSWHTTGALFEAQERYKEALVAFSFSLSIDPDYVPSIVSTAELLMKMAGSQVFPIARSLLMNALRIEPTFHDAWFSLGKLSKMEGSAQQAADFFQAAHELKLSAPVQSFV